ncbi:MAG: hypothetical protein IT361_18300 [Gemmatimonadaceae bacterium]|nr:hypothetical protein [Gemmatimonadaceae bacterium]
MRIPVLLGAVVFAANAVQAQSIPSISRTKAAATNAVAASNAQTRANSTLPTDSAVAAPAATPAAARRVATDSAAGTASVVSAGSSFERETFLYDRGGRRDPFVSLMSTSELRPLISDLRLVAVAYDAGGRNSVAVLHDVSTKEKEQYRIRVGQSLGRMRVSAISPRSVVFTIEEFGYSRQETLALGDSNKERKQ